jgi:membrane protein involved in colicin uptake
MAKTMCFVLGLALLALGILGITGFVPMFSSDPNYVNIGEIVLGGLGLLVGIYAHQGTKYGQQTKDLSRQSQDNTNRQRQENEQLKKENEQGRRDNIERQQQETEQLKKQLEQQIKENERLSSIMNNRSQG